jgi:hypothetical protein
LFLRPLGGLSRELGIVSTMAIWIAHWKVSLFFLVLNVKYKYFFITCNGIQNHDGVKTVTKMMKEITLDIGFNPSSISNKSLTSVVVIEQANYIEKLGCN